MNITITVQKQHLYFILVLINLKKKIRTEYSNFVIKIVRNQYKHLSSTFFHSDFIIIYHSFIRTKIKIQQVRQYQKRNI